jgi:hypothetical protein
LFKALLAVGAAAIALTATRSIARHHCVTVYQVGYSLGPSFSCTDFSALLQPIVTVIV